MSYLVDLLSYFTECSDVVLVSELHLHVTSYFKLQKTATGILARFSITALFIASVYCFCDYNHIY